MAEIEFYRPIVSRKENFSFIKDYKKNSNTSLVLKLKVLWIFGSLHYYYYFYFYLYFFYLIALDTEFPTAKKISKQLKIKN